MKALTVLTSGSLLGTLFTAIYQVVQTWIYTPDAIGTYAYLTAVPLMFISVPSLRYDIAVIVEQDDRRAMALVKLSWYLNIATSTLITLFYGLYLCFFAPEYRQYLYRITEEVCQRYQQLDGVFFDICFWNTVCI